VLEHPAAARGQQQPSSTAATQHAATPSHYNLGVALKAKGQLEEAIEAYRKAIQLDPNYANAYSNLGSALYDKGQLEEAIEAYRKAIQLDPNYADAYGNLALAL
jgi:superkiller protein 3